MRLRQRWQIVGAEIQRACENPSLMPELHAVYVLLRYRCGIDISTQTPAKRRGVVP